MTARIMFDIDGVPTPAADCDWQILAPCGCVVGLSVIERMGGALVTEDQALRAFEPMARKRQRMVKDGYAARLGLRSEGVRMFRLPCPHEKDAGW